MAERTEAPTPRRREEARRKGQVAKSVEVNSALILLAGFTVLRSSGPRLAEGLESFMQHSFASISTADVTLTSIHSSGLAVGMLLARTIAPLVLTIMAVGVVANLGQVGFFFSYEVLRPDPNRINPLNGFKRMFSARGLVELLKSLLKLAIIGFVVFAALRDNYPTIAASSRMPFTEAVGNLARVGGVVGLRAAMAMLVIAGADFIFQRREMEKNLRMTRQELQEEMKRQENPQLRARIRARQRQLAMNRMMAAVPQADVVITNPTHVAVALRYERGKPGVYAPQVVAKGQRLVAERIKETARANKVPIVENKPLARTLFKSVEVGHEIPVDLYQAVAEILAFVYRLK